MIMNDEQLEQVVDLISNSDYLGLLLKKLVDTGRNELLIHKCIEKLSDFISGNNDALGKFIVYCVSNGKTNEPYFRNAMNGMKNDTVMLRVFFEMLDKNEALCLEYYQKRRKPDGTAYLTNMSQIERMNSELARRGLLK